LHTIILYLVLYTFLILKLQIKKYTLKDGSIYLFPKLGNHSLEFKQFRLGVFLNLLAFVLIVCVWNNSFQISAYLSRVHTLCYNIWSQLYMSITSCVGQQLLLFLTTAAYLRLVNVFIFVLRTQTNLS